MNKTVITVLTIAASVQLVYADLPLYRATQFSLPWDVSVSDANSRGDVVYRQEFEGRRRTFVRKLNGDTTMLPLLPGVFAAAGVSINDHGTIAIAGFVNVELSRVYTWTETTGYVQMPDLPAPIDGNQEPTDITNSGIVSWSTFAEISQVNARGLWNTHTNEITFLPNTAGGNTQIQNLSEGGYAVATGYFSRIGAVYHPDGLSYQLRSSAAFRNTFSMHGQSPKVSDDGIVVSGAIIETSTSNLFATYVWDKFGNIIEERVNTGYVYDAISGDGLIAGSDFSQAGVLRPFLYELGGARVPLDGLVVERNFSGELRGGVRELFDNHAVFLVHGGGGVGVPQSYVFLEPVPEPGTMLALGAGLAALLRRRRTT